MTRHQPFVGERAYQEADAHLFFGRAAQVREARSLWLAERVVVLHGPEAAGKTSLLRAGLLPGLGPAEAYGVLPVERPPDTATIPDSLAEHRAKIGDRDKSLPFLAAFDRFEDAFSDSGRSQRERLIGELVAALEEIPELHLLLLIRQDFLPILQGNRLFAATRPRYLPVRPFTVTEATEVIVSALGASGMSFASGVADQLVRDLATVTFADTAGNTATIHRNQIEPLHLQVAGRGLWASLQGTAVITGERLRAWGGVDAALIDFYDSAVHDIAAEFGTSEARLRDWIRGTFVTELGIRDSARESRVAVSGIPDEVVNFLVARRILSTEYREGMIWYQLSHDRLAYAVLMANRDWERTNAARVGEENIPRTAHSIRAVAEAAFREGDLITAERNAAEAANKYQAASDWRGIADARVLEAEIARATSDLMGAERYLRAALSIFFMLEDGYSAARVLTALAELRFAAGDYAEAADLNRQAVERMPGDVTALTGLGYAQWQSGSPADAEATFGQVLRRDSDAAMALVGRGQVRTDLGRYAGALDDLDRALRYPLTLDVEADARSARAVALAALGRAAEARGELAASFQLDPDKPRSRLRAGRVAAVLGHLEEMRAEIERALNGRPSLSSAERDSANRILDSFR
jgi:tetratricopeptide (TPR) repeat protein